ncbi:MULTISPECIES: pentapeptide repeat-containing protein [Cyanophyceae]|uniref:pentapeptide repeat-containing protein n=1 Tax=Cyanophyceae TaxID=3028117 RepID=UPI00168331A0|nr:MULTISPECIES: pentapeptide repeat-containing protein [Cyanophyceae]MBD1916573.1 pentapeptide repeat-containing protein [Phormidium sp. FACHB-77]MBD2032140.1 pentapeptide repeat-containing protein [Phormidium sp. FACHB-322]MBD2053020.1 pentapeptide repeat-containing protein [Leptolyngbya sp. FACHB-60]
MDRNVDSAKYRSGFQKWVLRLVAPSTVFMAVILIMTIGIPTAWDIFKHWNDIEAKARAQAGITLLQTIVTTIGGIAIFGNIVIARRQVAATQQQMVITQEQIITDRFSKAVEQLGSDQLAVRVGAIYSLERIAKDSIRDHWTVMEVLSFFIQDRCPLRNGDEVSQKNDAFKDVQAAVIVLGRRDLSQDPKVNNLDLTYIELRWVSFEEGDFRNAVFYRSNLNGINFYKANLEKANFWQANLTRAKLFGADLSQADLIETTFSEADLRKCNLRGAKISRANFSKAKGLTVEQIQSAQKWEEAVYDESFRVQLGLNVNK